MMHVGIVRALFAFKPGVQVPHAGVHVNAGRHRRFAPVVRAVFHSAIHHGVARVEGGDRRELRQRHLPRAPQVFRICCRRFRFHAHEEVWTTPPRTAAAAGKVSPVFASVAVSPVNFMSRCRITSQYAGDSSQPYASRPSTSAAAIVVPEPMNGSKITSSGSENALMKN